MIRDLYINEKLIIYMEKNEKLSAFRIKENVPKIIDPQEIQFVKERASVMESLKNGSIMDITTDGTVITSNMVGTKGEGYSIPTSLEALENNLNAKRR